MAFIFYFYPFFFLCLYNVNIKKIEIGVFSGTFKARMLKLGIHMDNELLYCGRIGLLALILPFSCPVFCLLRLNMCHSFLRNCAS